MVIPTLVPHEKYVTRNSKVKEKRRIISHHVLSVNRHKALMKRELDMDIISL
jgi:hypothetical protein